MLICVHENVDRPSGRVAARSKNRGGERGVTLRELVTDALDRELHGAPGGSQPLKRLDFPLIRSGVPGSLRITPEDIRRVEEADDLRGMDRLP